MYAPWKVGFWYLTVALSSWSELCCKKVMAEDTVWADDELVQAKYWASIQTMLLQSAPYKTDKWTSLFVQYKILKMFTRQSQFLTGSVQWSEKFHTHWSVCEVCGIMLIVNEMVTNERWLPKFYYMKTFFYESVFSIQGKSRGFRTRQWNPPHKHNNTDIYIEYEEAAEISG